MARLIGQRLSQQLSQPVVIDNRGGAGGTIATEAAAAATPDGYTLFFSTTGTMAINPSLYRTMKVDPLKAFDAVGSWRRPRTCWWCRHRCAWAICRS